MRKKKRYFAVPAAILLSMSMSACGGGNTRGQTQPEPEETVVLETTAHSEETESHKTVGNDMSENTDIVTSSAELPFSLGQKIESDSFTGNAYIEMMIANDETYHFPQTNHLTFEPGARSSWHTHEGGQILIATDGIGYHQIEGEPVQVLYPGDVAMCPPGVKHWHGGSADTSFAHIAVNTNPELTGLTWFDRITEEEYAGLLTEKAAETEK